ncbi:putative nitric oxide synthase [Selaginella moellendorffii]|uniref:putative nitric oxide synthase n=1 Tax=Selaginella moellendorffii TaxID=88036 RepID=UPI000D1C2914|nr:putative nitric oxide synthase [Selaginella moellendorffii]|eukprot:XP_024530145.1 putative nitric oxide synthase [Selaginella moellendorffii]
MPVFSASALVSPSAFSTSRWLAANIVASSSERKNVKSFAKKTLQGDSIVIEIADKKRLDRFGARHEKTRQETQYKAGDSRKFKGPADPKESTKEEVSSGYVPLPSRGDKFLEEQKVRDQALVEKLAAKREKKKGKSQVVKLKSLEPCCYGCGAVLQYTQENTPGYINAETYELKKKHHQLKSVLCSRCQLMCHGKLIPAVGGYGIYGREKGFVTAEELRAQLAHIREERVLVLKLVDIVDFSGSFLTRVRDLVGNNPIVLVATKVDLLPEGTDLAAVGDWIVESTQRKKLNVISVHLTSAKYFMGITNIVKEIHRERQGRDVYILGAANVGKSAFISSLLKEMAARDPIAAVARKRKPVQSVLPGTTVGPISIDAFASGGSMYDTPGVHLHHRIETAISPDDLPSLFPARRLRGYVVSPILERKGPESIFSEALKQAEKDEVISNVQDLTGTTMFWGGIARIDVLKAPQNTRLTFYASAALRVHKVLTSEADEFYKRELGKTLVPPSDERASAWPGLDHRNKFTFDYDDTRPVGDIAISGLGWMRMEFLQTESGVEDSLELEVYVPRGIEVFRRPAIPVGANTHSWYSFSELTAEQEKTRPRLYYSEHRGL